MVETAYLPAGTDLAAIAQVLGEAPRISYAPPNIFPMSAPAFNEGSKAVRPSIEGNHLGVYAHVPYCSYHCSYCFYATKIGADPAQMRRYVNALLRELECIPPGTQLTQLYVGGGTPTALSPELLEELLATIWQRVSAEGQSVHTVESSPETITPAHTQVLRRQGIERVSMGIQSLDDEVLDRITRNHTREQALASCRLIVEAGLLLNIDLIYGLPGQTIESFYRDMELIATQGVHSFTAYNLRVNERTPVRRSSSEAERLDLNRLAQWRAAIKRQAAALGFEQTRWHTFRRREVAAPLDTVAARFRDITGQGEQIGVGMSARSRLQGTVYRNHAKHEEYLHRIEHEESPVEEVFPLADTERRLRYIALTLGDGDPPATGRLPRDLRQRVRARLWTITA